MKKYLAELIGTFCLVLFGCGTAVISGNAQVGPSGAGLLGISIAFGFAVVAMAYTIGGISGCHINPAVTLGVLVAGQISIKDAVGYFISQLLGAAAGAGVLYLIIGGGLGWTVPEWDLGQMAGAKATWAILTLPVLFWQRPYSPVFSFLLSYQLLQNMATVQWLALQLELL